LAPKENPPAAGAAAGASVFSAGFAPKENPEGAAEAFGVEPVEAGLEGAAGCCCCVDIAGFSGGLAKEKVVGGGFEAGVVEPAAAEPALSPEKRPPPAVPAPATGPVAAGLSLFRLANENDGAALFELAPKPLEVELLLVAVF
jgi:hypothetical protein